MPVDAARRMVVEMSSRRIVESFWSVYAYLFIGLWQLRYLGLILLCKGAVIRLYIHGYILGEFDTKLTETSNKFHHHRGIPRTLP